MEKKCDSKLRVCEKIKLHEVKMKKTTRIERKEREGKRHGDRQENRPTTHKLNGCENQRWNENLNIRTRK